MRFVRKILNLTKDDYRTLLKKDIYVIYFEKKDGDIRKLIGTLKVEFLPKNEKDFVKEKLDVPKKVENDNVLAVYDVLKQEWRSFRLDSIIAIKKFTNKFIDNKNFT